MLKVVIYFFIGVVAVNALTDSQKALMKVQIEFCSEKIGIPVEEPQTLINNVIKGEKEEYKCFSKCFLEQLGFMDKGAMVERDEVYNILKELHGDDPEAKLNEIIDACLPLTETGDCGTAYAVSKCYWESINPKSDTYGALVDPHFLD